MKILYHEKIMDKFLFFNQNRAFHQFHLRHDEEPEAGEMLHFSADIAEGFVMVRLVSFAGAGVSAHHILRTLGMLDG